MSVLFLMENKAQVNILNNNHESPIHYAIRRGDLKIIVTKKLTPFDCLFFENGLCFLESTNQKLC